MQGLVNDKMEIGEMAELSRTVTEADIVMGAYFSGDFNSLHMDSVAAEKSIFGERIAHGFFPVGLISAVIGTKLPGNGAVILSQNVEFKKPIKIGDTIKTVCKVVEIINKKKGIYKIKANCTNQKNENVVSSEIIIKYCVDNNQTILKRETLEDNNTFYSEEEMNNLGIKKYGEDVRISRNAILYNPNQLEIGNHVRIDDFSTISGKVFLGDYIHIAQYCGLYGGKSGIIMDDFSGLSSRVVIYATSNDYSGNSLTNPTVPKKYKSTDKDEAVHLCKHVVIGTGAVILPGVTVGIGSSVGALSLCTHDIDEWGVYVGTPAKKIRERSKKLLDLEQQLLLEKNEKNEEKSY